MYSSVDQMKNLLFQADHQPEQSNSSDARQDRNWWYDEKIYIIPP